MESVVRNKVTTVVESQLITLMSSTFSTTINAVIQAVYPISVPLPGGFSLCTALEGKIQLSDRYISIPIDGTIFKTDTGYRRVAYAEYWLPYYLDSSTENMVAVINEYVFETISYYINQNPIRYETNLFGVPIKVSFEDDVWFDVKSKGFITSGTVDLSIVGVFGIKTHVYASTDFSLIKGNNENIATLTIDVKYLSLSNT